MSFNPMDAFGAGLSSPSVGSISGGAGKDIFSLMYLYPEFGQFLQAAFAQGKNLNEALAPFMLTGKEGKKAMKNNPQGTIKGGKGIFYDIGAMSAALPGELDSASQYKIDQTQKYYEKLKNMPALATLSAQAEGKFDDEYMTAVDAAFGKIASGSIGAAAQQGFLADQSKLNATLLPVSESKAQYMLGTQQSAQAQLQALAGIPGAAGYGPAGMMGPYGQGGAQAGIMSGANLWLQQQMANMNAGLNYDQLKMFGGQWGWGFAKDAAAGAYAGGGGGGGGGGG